MNEPSKTDLSAEFSRLSADLLDQSMAKIRHCLNQLGDSQLWWRPEPTLNSIGNLCLHMAGNLRQWGVVPFTMATDSRDRDAEFSEQPRLSADELLGHLNQVVSEAKEQWSHLTPAQLRRMVDIQDFEVTLMHAIVHTSSHFVGHTHQIIMLTRMQLGANYQFHWSPSQDRGDLPI